ncbi:MAG: hypothetical protein GF347_04840 [Candidatus Moranbacteria bacterium]|nr:hypothetical protein [Candidatus Moranbacteria bacterium]
MYQNENLGETQKKRMNFLKKHKNANALIIITENGYLFICPKIKKVKFEFKPQKDYRLDWDEFMVWLRIETTPVSQILNTHLEKKSLFFKTV